MGFQCSVSMVTCLLLVLWAPPPPPHSSNSQSEAQDPPRSVMASRRKCQQFFVFFTCQQKSCSPIWSRLFLLLICFRSPRTDIRRCRRAGTTPVFLPWCRTNKVKSRKRVLYVVLDFDAGFKHFFYFSHVGRYDIYSPGAACVLFSFFLRWNRSQD